MRKTLRKVAATASAIALAIAVTATAVPASVSANPPSKAGKKAAKAEFDADGTYHAYFGFQETGTWIFRDEWYSTTLGIDGSDMKGAKLDFNGGTLFQSKDGKTSAVEGTKVQDAEIKGNGTYTVGVSDLNDCLNTNGDADTKVSMIYVDTDIPMSAKDNPVKISDVKLTCDGKEISIPSDPFYPSEYTDESGLLRFDPMNSYQKDKGEYADSPDMTLVPKDSIQITFTVSGFNSDNPDAVAGADDASSASSDVNTTSDTAASKKSSPVVPIVIVVVVVAVVAVVVVKKKK
ncbi:MAG: hypothetical protein MR965_10760 [Lachnospiraceae bacterium]|nr:hypothetical protein [Lachnospiraceae bacterium]